MSIGTLLGEFQKRVDSRVQLASFQGTQGVAFLEVKAGRYLSITIGNAQSAFANILSESQESVGSYVQNKLNELDSFIVALENRTNIIESMGKLTNVFNRSLFVGKHHLPKLQKISPQHIDLSSLDKETKVSFIGNFSSVLTGRHAPFLELNKMVYKPIRADSYCLDFTIEPQTFKEPYIQATLSVPYNTSWLGCCRPQIKIAEFSVWIGAQYDPVTSSDDECNEGPLDDYPVRKSQYEVMDL